MANFDRIGLKKLICTSYNPGGFGHKITRESGSEVKQCELCTTGDWQTEAISVGDEVDVVVTNPPFTNMNSLLRWLSANKKEYAVIAPFFTVSELVRFGVKLPRAYRLATTEFFVDHPEEFKAAHPYKFDRSKLCVSICQAMWITSFDAG